MKKRKPQSEPLLVPDDHSNPFDVMHSPYAGLYACGKILMLLAVLPHDEAEMVLRRVNTLMKVYGFKP